MKSYLRFIPNTITLLNLFCGSIAVISACHLQYERAFWFVILAALFDFFDGFAARLLKVTSEMGKELDSLADMVSFGLTPAIVMTTLLAAHGMGYFAACGLLLALFSALRLAKFNLDQRQSDEFRGLPTPANALFFVALPFTPVILLDIWVLLVLTVGFSLLMVCEMPMFALKFKSFALRKNKLKYSFLIVSAILIVIWKLSAVSWIIVLYIAVSALRLLLPKKA